LQYYHKTALFRNPTYYFLYLFTEIRYFTPVLSVYCVTCRTEINLLCLGILLSNIVGRRVVQEKQRNVVYHGSQLKLVTLPAIPSRHKERLLYTQPNVKACNGNYLQLTAIALKKTLLKLKFLFRNYQACRLDGVFRFILFVLTAWNGNVIFHTSMHILATCMRSAEQAGHNGNFKF